MFETSLAADRILADPDRVPCEAYECARNCVKDFEEENPKGVDDRKHYECLEHCPGTDYPTVSILQLPLFIT